MSQPEPFDHLRPGSSITDPSRHQQTGRRAFLGLGGAVTLALSSAAPALAATSEPALVPDSSCQGGLDPAELTGSRSALTTAARVAADRTQAPAATAAPRLDRRRARFGGCRFRSRAAWGADESLRFTATGTEVWVPTYWPVQTITVHHTADGSTDPDPAGVVRSIYRNQAINEGFGDIGYQFLIDATGLVYEGRWSGDDGLPGFNADGQMVNGAHVAGYNAGNVGIALLGNFMTAAPTDAAYRSLVDLIAGLARWQGLDPLATVDYVNPISGAKATVAAIPGHRDWAPTLCPGDVFAGMLGGLRADVAAR